MVEHIDTHRCGGVVTDPWTTAYLAALADPDETPPFIPQPQAFAAQTLRQSVRLRRGGSALRLVLSNEYGRAPLVIDEVAVDGRTVLHRGAARWEIPPGRTATSDPVPLSTTAGDDLVVSCFVSDKAGPASYLHSAQRTGEVAPGNRLGDGRLPDAERSTSLYWITRVLTDAPATGPVIVAFGDSITRGDGTTADRDQRYPDHLQRRLPDATVLNAGLGANRLLSTFVGPSMADRFARDVLSVPEATHVVIMGGINDIAQEQQRPTAGEIIEGLFALAGRAQAHGVQPALGTITPFMASIYESFRADGNEDIRRTVNHAITAQQDCPSSTSPPGWPTRTTPPGSPPPSTPATASTPETRAPARWRTPSTCSSRNAAEPRGRTARTGPWRCPI
jgi:lysophospholipase L1-like esterase